MTSKPGEGYFAGQADSAVSPSEKPLDPSDEDEILRKIREVARNNPDFEGMVRQYFGN